MNLKELIFGEGVHTGGSGGVYRDSVQAWLPIKNIIGGVVITKDNRFVKIMEVLPVNIYLKSAIDRQNIISSFASYLQIAPDELQMIARTLPADTQAYVEQMQRYAEQEENEACREMIEDNIREIGHGIAGGAMRHRFFLVFQYEPSMRAKRNTVQAIIQRLNEEADTARRYLDLCELEVSNQQKYILEILKEFKYLRVRQLHAMVRTHYRAQGIEIDARRMEIMLRQMRTGTNYVWLRGDVVSYGDRRIDPRLLEALDVMLELTKAQPGFYSKDGLHEPFLLRFTGNGKGAGYLFSVAWLDAATHIATVPRMKGERIIWISESNSFGEINLPRHHFFAVRQEDGTHRFFGSNEPGKI